MEEITGFPEITPQSFQLDTEDAAYYLISNNDIYSQVNAINRMYHFLGEENKDHNKKIKNYESTVSKISGTQERFFAEDDLINEYHLSSYYAAARSMCIVGIVVPGFESVFCEIFKNIKEIFGTDILNNQCSRSELVKGNRWDCHYYFENGVEKKGLAIGIKQLLIETELNDFISTDIALILDAIFSYRNTVFHNGFDWPEEEISKFTKKNSNWPNSWFNFSSTDNKPWLYYMSDSFQKIIINMFCEIYMAAGKYYLKNETSASI